MKRQIELENETFNDLLSWFSANREEAGRKYEEIRNGLMRFFYFKGCDDSETLADETFNRVAGKLSVLALSQNTKPANVFYGFASKIYLEHLANQKKREVEFDADLHAPLLPEEQTNENEDKKQECLKKCLAELPPEDGNLIVKYYTYDKNEKIERRKKLAESLEIKTGALQIKVFRLRNTLRKCVEKCAVKK